MKKYALLALLLCLALCLPALAAAEGETKPKIDVVWLIDTTGSIGSSRISAIKNKMDSFAAQLTDFDVRYSLVAFGDEANDRKYSGFDFPENTVWLTMGSSHWTNSCETLKSYIEQGDGKLPTYDGGDTPETSTNAIVRAARWIGNATDSETWRDGALRQFVLATDAEPKKTDTYKVQGKDVDVYSMQKAIDACLQRNISVSVASFYNSTRIENAYKDLVEKTDGTYQYVGDSTTFESLAKWIHDTPIVITQPEDLYLHDDDIVYLTAVTVKGRDTWSSWYYVNKYGYRQGLIGYLPNNDGIARYRWQVDRYLDGNEYYCVFSNSNRPTGDTRSIETRHAILHVASKFDITGQPQDVTTEAGKTATFTVAATGDELTYQWQKNVNGTWTNLSGETASTLSIPATLTDNGSEYRCVIKDAISDKQPGGYTLTSESAALTVVAAPAITGQPQDVTTEAGKTAVFTVTATGNKLTYQWQQQIGDTWVDMPGETGPSLSVLAATENSGSVYRCQVTSSYGTVVVSQPAALTVDGAPAITGHPQNVTTEAGKTAVFTVTATGTGLTYQWQQQVNGSWVDMPGETGTTLTVTATTENSGSVYRCRVTSSYGTVVVSQPAALTMDGAPAITGHPQNVTTEAGKTAVFTVAAAGTGLKYQWQKQSGSGWADMPGETGTSLTVPATTENSGSVYRCRVTSSYDTVVVSDPAVLTVDGAPVITGHPQNVTTEAGKTAVFTVAATGTGLTYQWQKQVDGGWDDLPGETGTSLTVPATTENSGSVYRCRVTSSYGTVVVSQPATLTVDGAPAITGQPESVVVTEGEDASITVAATGEGLKYQWQVYRSGVWMNCTDGQSPTLTLSAPALEDNGLAYRCVITSSYGTTVTSDTVTLTVLAKVEPPQTGDTSRPWLWLTLLGASLLGLAMLRRRRA